MQTPTAKTVVPPSPEGDDDSSDEQNNGTSAPREQMVPVSRLHGVVAQRQELKKKLEAMEAAEAKRREDELAAKGQHEQLAREANERAVKAEEEVAKIKADNERQKKLFAVALEARNSGAVDADDLIRFVDIDALAVKDGQVEGVKEVVETLKKSKPYLFGSDTVTAPAPKVAQAQTRTTGSKAITKAEFLKSPTLMSKTLRENPQEYDRIMRLPA